MSKKKITFPLERGFPLPGGATQLGHGFNFAIFSRHATEVSLVIGLPGHGKADGQQFELDLDPEINRTGDIWHIFLVTDRLDLTYGYRFDGERDIHNQGLSYDRDNILLDPLCQNIKGRGWGEIFPGTSSPLCKLTSHDFDWQDDRPLKTPMVDSIIYELHVRGFTRDPSSNVQHPGTYLGIIEKIPYLKKLGVTAVELMPVTEWDENDNTFFDPDTGKKLKNYWGYNPISFSALKAGFAANPGQHIREFKTMILSLHQAGIEVILDMVYNHTGEGGYQGKVTSFRGIDNPIFYLLDPHSHEYLNYSGCGNTFNCNHPVVRELIRESLRYWVMEMHVDGFRFDLASILGRDSNGDVLANPPMIEMIAQDPILRDTKIIAEAWDAAGLYQVGTFSTDRRWAEWNGKFRDDVRAFMASHSNTVANLATRIAGSSDLYQTSARSPCNSVNFITSHDGFTLYDLVSYEEKHNLRNGERNRDGDNHNISWNSGVEGENDDSQIRDLRFRRIRTMAVLLIFSQGVPMITAGDEFGRSQGGNNNCWCQDNETSWINWKLAESNDSLLRFFRKCLQLRKDHILFRRRNFFSNTLRREISWQSLTPGTEDWSSDCRSLAFLLRGKGEDDDFFFMFNGQRAGSVSFTLPAPPDDRREWRQIIDSAAAPPLDFPAEDQRTSRSAGENIKVQAMAAVILQSAR